MPLCGQLETQANGLAPAECIPSEPNQAAPADTNAHTDTDTDDEDVRQARANMKGYLERMRETDAFLKQIEADERRQQEQRAQDRLLFDSLLLNGPRPVTQTASTTSGSLLTSEPTINLAHQLNGTAASQLDLPKSTNIDISFQSNTAPNTLGSISAPITSSSFGAASLFGPLQTSLKRPFRPKALDLTSEHFKTSSWLSGPPCGSLDTSPSMMSNSITTASYNLHNQQQQQQQKSALNDSLISSRKPPEEVVQSLALVSSSDSKASGLLSMSPAWSWDRSSYMTTSGRRTRPLSASIGDHTSRMESYLPSARRAGSRRSFSQIRSNPVAGLSSCLFGQDRSDSPPATSEYRAAFCGSSQARLGSLEPTSGDNLASKTSSTRFQLSFGSHVDNSVANSNHDADGDGEDEDDGMSSYRASSYVPKVVPQGMPARGRSHQRRQAFEKAEIQPAGVSFLRASSPDIIKANSPIRSSRFERSQLPADRYRRSSLQTRGTILGGLNGSSDYAPTSVVSRASRRLSVDLSTTDNGDSGESKTKDEFDSIKNGAQSSRLSELEQRIAENRKRREEMLAGRYSPVPNTVRDPTASCNSGKSDPQLTVNSVSPARGGGSREPSPGAVSSKQESRRCRPSRLESMEARIKRKSYCVRVADCSPERGRTSSQVGLESWRPASRRNSTSQLAGLSSVSASVSLGSPRLSGPNLELTSRLLAAACSKMTDDKLAPDMPAPRISTNSATCSQLDEGSE